MLVLRHNYPNSLSLKSIKDAIDRKSPGSVGNATRKMWKEKLIEGDSKGGYILTEKGRREASEVALNAVQN